MILRLREIGVVNKVDITIKSEILLFRNTMGRVYKIEELQRAVHDIRTRELTTHKKLIK